MAEIDVRKVPLRLRLSSKHQTGGGASGGCRLSAEHRLAPDASYLSREWCGILRVIRPVCGEVQWVHPMVVHGMNPLK